MRLSLVLFVSVVGLACAHRAPSVVARASAPSPHPNAPPADASAPRRVVRHRAPEAAPTEFQTNTEAHDVDRDGRNDLVRSFPELRPIRDQHAWFRDMPPVMVAHRLDDGRYALDDEVTRASLRALCPAAPGASLLVSRPYDENEDFVEFAEELFVEGFCHRVWGASVDASVARVRATAGSAPDGRFTPETVDVVVNALRAFPVPQELEALEAPPLPPMREQAGFVAPPEAPRDPRCAPAERAVAAWNTRARRAAPSPPHDAPLADLEPEGSCLAFAQGVWSVALRGLRVTGAARDTVQTTGLLTWRPLVGRASAALPFELEVTTYSAKRVALLAGHDYDGDGAPEVVARTSAWVFEDGTDARVTVYTVRDGAVVPYARAGGVGEITDVVDADHDGRPDLVLRSPWSVFNHGGMMGYWEYGPSLLAHALADGGFSTTDDVARAWALARCERPAGEPGSPDPLDVGCARIRGVSPDHVVAALQSREPAGSQRVTPNEGSARTFQSLAVLALIPAPFAPVREGEALPTVYDR